MEAYRIYEKENNDNTTFMNENGEITINEKYLDWLEDIIDSIPCICGKEYKSRNISDPNCPRCNYVINWKNEL